MTLADYTSDSNHPVTRFTVIGERASGTNVIDSLVATCFSLERDNRCFPWKHGFPSAPGYHADTLFIIAVRNAHSWIKSLYRRPHHATQDILALDFPSFIRSEWKSNYYEKLSTGGVARGEYRRAFAACSRSPLEFDRHPIEGRNFRSPIELRTIKLEAHCSMLRRAKNVCIVRLEDVQADPNNVATTISKIYGLKQMRQFALPEKQLGHFHDEDEKRKLASESISIEDADFIQANLNLDLEARLGYEY